MTEQIYSMLHQIFLFLEDGDQQAANNRYERIKEMEQEEFKVHLTQVRVELWIRKAFLNLEKCDWLAADEYCQKILSVESENAIAYLAKLMAMLKVSTREGLKDCKQTFDGAAEYAKVMCLGDAKLKAELQGYIQYINKRNENARLESLYQKACGALGRASTEADYKNAAEEFEQISHYKDAKEKATKCREMAEKERKDAIYRIAVTEMSSQSEHGYAAAIQSFKSISGWKDADAKILTCQQKIQELKAKEEAERLARVRASEQARIKVAEKARKRKIHNTILAVATMAAVAVFLVMTQIIIPNQKYDAAMALMNNREFYEAITAFEEIKTYKDSVAQIRVCENAILNDKYYTAVSLKNVGKYADAITAFTEIKAHKDSVAQIKACETAVLDTKYDDAIALKDAGKYNEAISAFEEIKEHKDSAAQIKACETALLDVKYTDAVTLLTAGKYADAYDAFIALNGYKDSEAQASAIAGKVQVEKLAKARVGDYVTFGSYEQDNKTRNGKEDIEWLVLAKENNRILVISRYVLDCQPYNKQSTNVTWETCTLRTWLNKDFLNAAFSSTEQAMIPTVTVSADKNPWYSTNPGNATQDKVFLLSITEANKYFKINSARQCKPTAYANVQGASTNSSGFGWWWLRSPGNLQNHAAYVSFEGIVIGYGSHVNYVGSAIRPALWIDLVYKNIQETVKPSVIVQPTKSPQSTATVQPSATPHPTATVDVNTITKPIATLPPTNTPQITAIAPMTAPPRSTTTVPITSSTQPPVFTQYIEITSTNANIRTGPNSNTMKITSASRGECFILLGEENGWYKISVDGQVGYVSMKLAKIK